MARSVNEVTHIAETPWRELPAAGREWVRAGMCAGGNGTTTFGLILGGALMTKDGNSKYRPLGVQGLIDAIAAANLGKVTDSSGFYVGDEIDIFAGADAFASAEWDVTPDPSAILVTALVAGAEPGNRIDVKITDPSGNNQPLAVTMTEDFTDLLIDVSIETDGGGALISTLAEVIAAINDAAGAAGLVKAELGSGANGAHIVSAAVVAQSLAGGHLIGDELVSNRTITLIDRTTTPHEITFDGAVVTQAVGDVLANAVICYGVSQHQVDTSEKIPGGVEARDRGCSVSLMAAVESASLGGYDDALQQYLAGGPATGALGATDGWPIVGFVFLP